MKYILIIIFIFNINTIQAKMYNDIIKDFDIIEVRDGDTFIISIHNIPKVFGEKIAVRIRGIDTP